MNRKLVFFQLIFVVAAFLMQEVAGATPTWADVQKFVSDRKVEDNVSDARVLKPGKNDVPAPVVPTCTYPTGIEFSIAISGEQNFLFLTDASTNIYSVLSEWIGNALKLNTANFPDRDAAILEMQRIQGLLLTNGQANDKFSTIIDNRDHTHDATKAAFVYFQTTFAPGLGFLNIAPASLPDFLELVGSKGFLHRIKRRGLGDMTLSALYHTPAVPEKDVAVGNPFIADSTINLVIEAQRIGLLVAPTLCSDIHGVQDSNQKVRKDHKANSRTTRLGPGVGYCCCNNIAHSHYRTCIKPTTGSPTCNTCGNNCCLAGVTWCASAD